MVLKILLLRYKIGQENKLFKEEYNLFIADDKYVKKQSVINLHNKGTQKMLSVESEIYFLKKIKFYERKYLCFIYT